MKLIKMDGAYDCGAAVLAMVLGLPGARAAYPLLGYDPSEPDAAGVGTSEEELMGVLNTCKISYARYLSLECMAKAQNVSVEAIARRCKVLTSLTLQNKLAAHKGQALVSVPRLFAGDGYVPGHFVLVENGKVYDPARGTRYTGSVSTLPICSVLILTQKSAYVFAEDAENSFHAVGSENVEDFWGTYYERYYAH